MADRGDGGERQRAGDKRLDSWKEIAAFCGRSVRTVRRWEQQERLPVHRHRHARGTSVYAYESELRSWQAHRAERPATAPPSHGGLATASRRVCAIAVAVTVITVALLWWGLGERPAARSAPMFKAESLTSAAAELVWSGRPASAARLFREALELEPNAAEAMAGLGWALRETGQPPAEYLPLLDRATAAARGPRERLLTGAIRDDLAGRTRPALDGFEALLAVEPRHEWARRRALALCREERLAARCLVHAEHVAAVAPRDLVAAVEAAWEAALWSDDATQVDRLEKRARRLAEESPPAAYPEALARLETLPARRAWVDANPAVALAALERNAARLHRWPSATRDRIAVEAGLLALALGRVTDSLRWFSHVADVTERRELNALALFMGGRLSELREELTGESSYRHPFTGVLLTAAGLRAEAASLSSRLEPATRPEARVLSALGALGEDRPAAAASQLESALGDLEPGTPFFFVAWDLLAAAHEKQGHTEAAVSALEWTSPQRRRSAFEGAGPMWLRCQGRLAALYRRAQLEHEAGTVEAELKRLLAYADSAHPLRQALAGHS